VIRSIGPDCRADLPADSFHFVFTHDVLEHVADIDAVTAEIARVTAPGGCGFHVYPGRLRPLEPHLFMPFVHWLPKQNPARKWLIRACIVCGVDPKWDWLATATSERKADAYWAYCNQETFYRTYRRVRGGFNQVGFEVTPVAADHPSLRRLSILPAMLKRFIVEIPVRLFQTVEIVVHKPATAQRCSRLLRHLAQGRRQARLKDRLK
jgi:SAM-dependent methyltransferase